MSSYIKEQLIGIRQQLFNLHRQVSELMAEIDEGQDEQPPRTRRTFGSNVKEAP